jgi:phenylacetate-CoA ligase
VVLADPAVGPQYLLVMDHRAAQPRLVVCCEALSAPFDGLAERLSGELREVLGLRCRVVVGPPGSLPRTETGKAVRVLRWESGEPPVPGL